ncbi:DUF2891 domain-containing protein [Pararcticibacter amylolyticus]|uniref:DUF2891 domain-containing protein n=1 Tax=Pararcticibacter amylolyticus TaxID=2173175 RepID=A0A2U2PDL4_9SPHI|nr:DUF2891 domain-containing protein [Pararcticibacter amylolyticus]PWG79501.1 DUF2891 domain-containing protein [Pararcticibacter amylolyticus]
MIRFFTKSILPALFFSFSNIASEAQETHFKIEKDKYILTREGASHLAALPLKCMQQEFPYKTGITFSDTSLLGKPRSYHPAFYGCYDWHSSVHGHWMLIRLLKLYPGLPEAALIREKLTQNLSADNINQEVQIFRSKENKGFERTYGWAWLLQLQNELLTWNDPFAKQLANNMKPLAQQLSVMYQEYLPKMAYPVRVGEHSNLAFGLRLAWDYAETTNDNGLKNVIKETALRFYKNDANAPLAWEPGGSDFLSPSLEEADLMWRILSPAEYQTWVVKFLPSLFTPHIALAPGQVKDRSDGKLVHLDGLNLSRAWDLYGIAKHAKKNKTALINLANTHLKAALQHVASGDYMGEHWLASFAVYALTMQ